MKHKRTFFGVFIILVLGLSVNAQSVNSTAGGEASGEGGTASYTIGQVAFSSVDGVNGAAVVGVQQVYTVSVVTGMENAQGVSLSITAYPNPATDFLTLKVEDFEFLNLKFQMYDLSGRVLQSQEIHGSDTRIDLFDYVSSTYFLKVFNNSKIVKSFKIVKK